MPKAHSTICKSCELQGGVSGEACLRSWCGVGEGWMLDGIDERQMRLEREFGLFNGVHWCDIAA